MNSQIQFGVKGHLENAWSTNIDEQIRQFFFQLVRSKDMSNLKNKLVFMLDTLSWSCNREQLFILLRIIVHTRDIVNGKGEYDLSFMQLLVWYKYYPKIAFRCFKLFLDTSENPLEHQYGSWKDMKRFCQYIKDNSVEGENHPLIISIISFSIQHLKWEYERSIDDVFYKPTLVGKWFPREKSKYGWLFNMLAVTLNPLFTITATNHLTMVKGYRKQKMALKKMIVYLNKRSDTVQIKMCDGKWSGIDFNKVTSLSMAKIKNSILYVNKSGDIMGDDPDRLQCRENYKKHISLVKSGDTTKKIHGKCCQVGELVRSALSCNIDEKSVDIMDTINEQWNSNLSNNKALSGKSIVTMCDVSESMDGDALHNAIGLCIRISELVDEDSGFKNRIMTFEDNPTWIQLTEEQSFVEKVHLVRQSCLGTGTNFHLALDKIVDVLVEKEIHPLIVKNLIFAVFSDMQFDNQSINILDTMEGSIHRKFINAGMQTKWQQPYETPRILFWNLKNTTGFPAISVSNNITFLSGYSSTLLNVLCSQGKFIRHTDILQNLLNVNRYNIVNEILCKY